jgi:hypothetical protein
MRLLIKSLALLLLLMSAQQGAVVHELSHLPGFSGAELQCASGGVADTTCALCPAFAQVVTPAFSHAFHIPLLVRAGALKSPEPRFSAIDATVPRPRSRGPPSLS